MRNRATAIILGAGSSKVFGLPLGSELRTKIAKDLDIRFGDFGTSLESGSYQIVEALRAINGPSGDINPHRRAAVQISQAMALSGSIDEYIERHSEDSLKADCAKLAICKSILEAERNSSIFVDPHRSDFVFSSQATNSWIAYFLRDLTRGFSKLDLKSAFKNITIINFNYDRCLEHFCFNWLQQLYELDHSEAADIVRSIVIYHPYGRIAPLPFENRQNHVPYGGQVDAIALVEMAKRIQTYSEAKTKDAELSNIIERLEDAKSLIFLGFGFHQQNLDLLSINMRHIEVSLDCYATIEGVSEPRWEVYKDRISYAFKIPPHRELRARGFRGKCEDFWSEFSDAIIL